MGSICCHKPSLPQEQGLGFSPLPPTLQPTRCSALKIIIKSWGVGGGGEKEACHNEVKLLPMQELEAARTLLSTMNVSHFHTPPAGSQLCGTFGFKCTIVISATSEAEHPSFFFCFSSSHLPKSKLHWVSTYTWGHRARDQKMHS